MKKLIASAIIICMIFTLAIPVLAEYTGDTVDDVATETPVTEVADEMIAEEAPVVEAVAEVTVLEASVVVAEAPAIPVSASTGDATVSAVMGGSGNQQNVTITVTDSFGTHAQTFSYTNGTRSATYTINATAFKYTVEINFQGNSPQRTTITSVEITLKTPDNGAEPGGPGEPANPGIPDTGLPTIPACVIFGCNWDDGEETTAPTFFSEGVMTFTCDVCEDTKTESIPALEINVNLPGLPGGDYEPTNPGIPETGLPTLTECMVFGCDYVFTVTATCWTGGWNMMICSVCSEDDGLTYGWQGGLGHMFIRTEYNNIWDLLICQRVGCNYETFSGAWETLTKEATCTTEGYTGRHHIRSGWKGDYVYTPALGHAWVGLATWDGHGWWSGACERCEWQGYLSYSPQSGTVEPTCTLEGYDFIYDLNSDQYWYSNYVPALGHIMKDCYNEDVWGNKFPISKCVICGWQTDRVEETVTPDGTPRPVILTALGRNVTRVNIEVRQYYTDGSFEVVDTILLTNSGSEGSRTVSVRSANGDIYDITRTKSQDGNNGITVITNIVKK